MDRDPWLPFLAFRPILPQFLQANLPNKPSLTQSFRCAAMAALIPARGELKAAMKLQHSTLKTVLVHMASRLEAQPKQSTMCNFGTQEATTALM
jgi:hypothetical protein